MVISVLVTIVDDDESVRESLPGLLRQLGYATQTFSSAEDFLVSGIGETRCLILDVVLPGMSGSELQLEMLRRGHRIPIIFITGLADEALREGLLSRGAVACLFKPFSEAALREALKAALPVN